MSGPGLDRAGKHERKTMIRKKWSGGEPVLSVETEDEFWKAVSILPARSADAGGGPPSRERGAGGVDRDP